MQKGDNSNLYQNYCPFSVKMIFSWRSRQLTLGSWEHSILVTYYIYLLTPQNQHCLYWHLCKFVKNNEIFIKVWLCSYIINCHCKIKRKNTYKSEIICKQWLMTPYIKPYLLRVCYNNLVKYYFFRMTSWSI